jgi:hypothetical protein
MNDLPILPPKPYIAYSATAELTVELAKVLALVAPISMTTEQQELWLRAAVDALDGIRGNEVNAISAELRRSVTRHNQIVPEIAKLVSEKRARTSQSHGAPPSREWEINQEAANRRASAKSQAEINDCWEWERQARIDAGLHVEPYPKPLRRDELDRMPEHIRKLGLNCGFLEYRNGQVIEIPLKSSAGGK